MMKSRECIKLASYAAKKKMKIGFFFLEAVIIFHGKLNENNLRAKILTGWLQSFFFV